jgi:hypothetical protein
MDFIFEILFELIGQVLFELLGELLAAGFKRLFGSRFEFKSNFPVYILIAILGFTFGFISLHIYAQVIKIRIWRIANLVLTPIFMGFILHYIGQFKKARGKNLLVLDRFLGGYLFALAFAIARFSLAK